MTGSQNHNFKMNPKFPLPDVTVRMVESARKVEIPLYADGLWQINQHEFAMQVEEVGSFYACHGDEVEYTPAPEASPASIELYLNGSVYGAILHQRNILPLHGSCFIEKGTGVIICGESGAGKSSLTAAFCMNGSTFFTDDVTPLVLKNGQPHILALSDRIKLRSDSLEQFGYEKTHLAQIFPNEDKYYFPMGKDKTLTWPLNLVFILEITNEKETEFFPLNGIAAFTALRNEIYRWEYLQAMPDTETSYLNHLLILSQQVKVIQVKRPERIAIEEMRNILAEKIAALI
jgi:hypothetical protein